MKTALRRQNFVKIQPSSKYLIDSQTTSSQSTGLPLICIVENTLENTI